LLKYICNNFIESYNFNNKFYTIRSWPHTHQLLDSLTQAADFRNSLNLTGISNNSKNRESTFSL